MLRFDALLDASFCVIEAVAVAEARAIHEALALRRLGVVEELPLKVGTTSDRLRQITLVCKNTKETLY